MGRKFFKQTLDNGDYDIMRCLSTSLEQPYFSKLNRFFPKRGHFCCKACGNPLYSYETKFDVDDGWPAFGACILGSIGIIPAEERKSQIEKEDKACIKIQACVRGKLCRKNIENMLDEMIRELMEKKEKKSLVETENIKLTSNDNCDENNFSDERKKSNRRAKDTGYILSRELGQNYAEIHCHRCKSHLGDVFAEENEGNQGEKYLEHHRVNGRSLKYMHTNLPKKTMTRASLLFAKQSQRRCLGLPDVKQNDEHYLPFRKNLISKKDHCKPSDLLSISDHKSSYQGRISHMSSDPLSVSYHSSDHQNRNRYRGSDPSSSFQRIRHKQSVILDISDYQSFSQNSRNMPLTSMEQQQKDRNRLLPPCRKIISFDPLGSVSCHERMMTPTKTNTSSRRRPMRRGSTQSLVNIEERKDFLERSFQHPSQ